MGMYFVCYYVDIVLLTEENSYSNFVALPLQMFFIALLLLYFASVLLRKLFGQQLQAVIRKAQVVWSSIVKHPRDHSGGELIESFDRELDASTANSYPPLLGESQKTTY